MIGERFDDVLADARKGSEAAFTEIYRDFAPQIMGLARGKGLRDPDDVVTETMLSVVRGLGRFQGQESDFRSWVFTIAYRRIADEYRRRSRKVVTVSSGAHPDAGATGSAEEVVLSEALSPEMATALARLNEDQRDVLLLRVIVDLPIAEVAKVLGKKEGAVKMIQSRALRAMAGFLQPEVSSAPLASDRSW